MAVYEIMYLKRLCEQSLFVCFEEWFFVGEWIFKIDCLNEFIFEKIGIKTVKMSVFFKSSNLKYMSFEIDAEKGYKMEAVFKIKIIENSFFEI